LGVQNHVQDTWQSQNALVHGAKIVLPLEFDENFKLGLVELKAIDEKRLLITTKVGMLSRLLITSIQQKSTTTFI